MGLKSGDGRFLRKITGFFTGLSTVKKVIFTARGLQWGLQVYFRSSSMLVSPS